MADKIQMTIAAHDKNYGNYSGKFMQYAPYVAQVTEFAKLVLANAVKWVRSGGYIYVSFMEGKQPGFETTSFSDQPLYFNYFQEDKIKAFLESYGMECIRSARQDYPEPNGEKTTDVFLFLKKQQPNSRE